LSAEIRVILINTQPAIWPNTPQRDNPLACAISFALTKLMNLEI
jgi:hypothetical protein